MQPPYGSAQTVPFETASISAHTPKETTMYIGGGILGTLLIVCLIVYLVRRV